MPILHKHSNTAGAEPNLCPGNIGINLTDEIVWIRANGRRVGISIDKWRYRTAPVAGLDGAPLVMGPSGPEWDGDLVPASVVDGEIQVDLPPPVGAFGIPGCRIESTGAGINLAGNSVIVEDFYVASDVINIQRFGFEIISTLSPGAVRLGIVDAANNLMFQTVVATPTDHAVNTANISLDLARGHYRTVLWCQSGLTLRDVNVYRQNQGWDHVVDDLSFVKRHRGSANLSGGIDLSAVVLTAELDTVPGESKVNLLRWVTP